MPELPEAETLARDIDAATRNRMVVGVEVRKADVLSGVRPASLRRRILGTRIVRVWRRAKAVVIDFSGGEHLVVRLGFTGGLVTLEPDQPGDSHDTVRIQLDDGSRLVCRDVRRLGRLSLLTDRKFAEFDRRIGMEPLGAEFTTEALWDVIRHSSQPIKKLLMDQQRVAGVGNIYANEALWATRIDPSRTGSRITSAEADELRQAIADILTRAVAARGTSFRDFRDGHGREGGFIRQLHAYGREGQPCHRCGTRLTSTHAVDGRATVFCHRCQH